MKYKGKIIGGELGRWVEGYYFFADGKSYIIFDDVEVKEHIVGGDPFIDEFIEVDSTSLERV